MINRFNNSFQAVADTIFEELSWKQIFFLNCVVMFPEPPTIKDMANLLGCSHQNAKQLLLKLEKTGYLQIQQDSADRRKQRILLTPKAKAFRSRYDKPSEEAMQQLFQGISGEALENTIQTFFQLIANVDSMKETRE